MNIQTLLEAKWGAFEENGHSLTNGKMPFVSEQARLNMLFPTSNFSSIISSIHSKYDCKLPDQLMDFYQLYNGCRLFFGSLNVFGIQSYPNELYQPYDIFMENNHIIGSLNKKDKDNCSLLFVASIGDDYAYGFDKNNPVGIIGIRKGSLKPVQKLPDFNAFFTFHFNRLIGEYDNDCRKIHPQKQFQGIPTLEHITLEIS